MQNTKATTIKHCLMYKLVLVAFFFKNVIITPVEVEVKVPSISPFIKVAGDRKLMISSLLYVYNLIATYKPIGPILHPSDAKALPAWTMCERAEENHT